MIKYLWHKEIGPVFIITIFGKSFALCFCHRKEDRTIRFFGFERFLCARCLGILIGAILGSIFLLINLNFYGFAPFLLAPLIIDGTGQALDYWESINIVRLITGIFFSVGLFQIYFITIM